MFPWFAVLFACSGDDAATTETGAVVQQGIVVSARDLAGERLLDAVVRLGGVSRADPDSSGLVYFLAVPPGRTPVWTELEGTSVAHGAPSVEPDQVSMARIVPLPLTWADLPEAADGGTGGGGGLQVEVPAGVLEASGPWRFGHHRAAVTDALAVPGDHVGVKADDDLGPILIHEAFSLRATDDLGEDLAVVPDSRLPTELALPAGSPLRAPGAEVRLYQFSSGRAYWVYAGDATVDGDGIARFEIGGFGWFGLALEGVERSCVTGRVVDGSGLGLTGAEVRLVQDGLVAPDRVTTVDGGFCVSVDLGASATLSIAGFDATLEHLYTGELPVTGGATAASCAAAAACVELGTIAVDTWVDADQDRSFAGPGGDCDDADPAVSPNPASGDGSWCGGLL